MSKSDDLFHGFPKSVDGFATKFGQWSTKVRADGNIYQWLKMNGSYGGKTGTFEYIKDANGKLTTDFLTCLKFLRMENTLSYLNFIKEKGRHYLKLIQVVMKSHWPLMMLCKQ